MFINLCTFRVDSCTAKPEKQKTQIETETETEPLSLVSGSFHTLISPSQTPHTHGYRQYTRKHHSQTDARTRPGEKIQQRQSQPRVQTITTTTTITIITTTTKGAFGAWNQPTGSLPFFVLRHFRPLNRLHLHPPIQAKPQLRPCSESARERTKGEFLILPFIGVHTLWYYGAIAPMWPVNQSLLRKLYNSTREMQRTAPPASSN